MRQTQSPIQGVLGRRYSKICSVPQCGGHKRTNERSTYIAILLYSCILSKNPQKYQNYLIFFAPAALLPKFRKIWKISFFHNPPQAPEKYDFSDTFARRRRRKIMFWAIKWSDFLLKLTQIVQNNRLRRAKYMTQNINLKI